MTSPQIELEYPPESHEFVTDGPKQLTDEELRIRRAIGREIIQHVPKEALERLQIIQPAIGCVNRCNFCSQLAGPVARELDAPALQAIIGGIKEAMEHHELDQLGGDRSHKPGVIFPYLDNDSGSYPHLLELIEGMADLNTKTRISTVSWSRHNPQLQAMHETIASEHQNNVDGIRFSLTPYTHGWRTNHDEYIADLANAVHTYQPFMETNGTSRRTACMEVRFRPDVSLGELTQEKIGNYTALRCEDYTLLLKGDLDQKTIIEDMGPNGAELNTGGLEAINILGNTDDLREEKDIDSLFESLAQTESYQVVDEHKLAKKGKGHAFSNQDGEYYCFEPLKTDQGFNAVHYYPKTATRTESGVLDATRPLLNTMVAYKKSLGHEIRDDVPEATEEDINAMIASIQADCETIEQFSESRAEYIRTQVLPLIKDAAEVIKRAGLTPDLFFQYGFMIDTGIIVNQGKAITEFRGLVSKPDMPLTPNEEKGYGATSQSSVRGVSWRIAPVEVVADEGESRGYGKKSLPLIGTPEAVNLRAPRVVKLGFFALNPEAFTSKDSSGVDLPVIHVPLPEAISGPLRVITPGVGQKNNLLPGSKIQA